VYGLFRYRGCKREPRRLLQGAACALMLTGAAIAARA